MQPGSVLRLGIVGCGAVTERYHLPAIVALRDVRVTAVVDPIIERARALGVQLGARSFASHTALPGSIDIALVAAPNPAHAPAAVDLLRAGVHVLVEKPMARTTEECDRMIAAAAQSGAVLAVGHDFRHFPVARFAKDLFGAGVLGAVRRVDVRQDAGTRWPSLSALEISREGGGGVLLNFGVHVLDLLLWWLGDLHVAAYRDDAMGGVEAECECEFQGAGGAPVHVEVTRCRRRRDTAIVECEQGTVELGVFDPAVVRLSLPGGGSLDGSIPDAEFERAPLRTVFTRQLADFVGAVRDRRPPLVGGSDGRRAVALVEACYAQREPLRRSWDRINGDVVIGRRSV